MKETVQITSSELGLKVVIRWYPRLLLVVVSEIARCKRPESDIRGLHWRIGESMYGVVFEPCIGAPTMMSGIAQNWSHGLSCGPETFCKCGTGHD